MIRTALASFCLLAGALPLSAQPPERVRWSASWEKALEEAAERNVPVLLVFLSDEEECEQLRAELLSDRKLIRFVNEQAVAALAHPGSHTKGDNPGDCPLYHTIPCSAHHVTHDQASQRIQGSPPAPSAYVCSATGHVLRERFELIPQALIGKLTEAQEEIGGRPIRASVLAEARQAIEQGDGKVEQGKFKAAIKAYQSLAEDEEAPSELRETARQRLDSVLQGALIAVEQARAMPGRRARKALSRLLREFGQLEAAREAIEQAQEALR